MVKKIFYLIIHDLIVITFRWNHWTVKRLTLSVVAQNDFIVEIAFVIKIYS